MFSKNKTRYNQIIFMTFLYFIWRLETFKKEKKLKELHTRIGLFSNHYKFRAINTQICINKTKSHSFILSPAQHN